MHGGRRLDANSSTGRRDAETAPSIGARRRYAQAASSAVAAGLGVATLVGWAWDVPVLTGLGADAVPMPPSNAVLFVVLGGVLALRAQPTRHQHAAWASRAASTFVAMVAGALLVLWLLDVRSPLEHLGMAIGGDVHGAPVGYMSPVSAACFLLTSFTFVVATPGCALASLRRRLALGSAAVLLAVSLVFLLAYLYGMPLLYGSGFIPPALNTTVAFSALGVGLLVETGASSKVIEDLRRRNHASLGFLLVFVVLGTGMVAAGRFYYQAYERHYRAQVERQLVSVTDLKVDELTRWRQERLGDGAVLFGNASFSRLVEHVIGAPQDGPLRARLQTWLESIREASRYERVFLLDADGAELAASPARSEPVAPPLQAAVRENLRNRSVSFLDFHRAGPSQPIHLSVLIPIYELGEGGRALGVVVLRIDPTVNLYPIVRRWPTPSRTAEALLVRREGGDVLFLNELRFREDAALSLRIPLGDVGVPAVKAVLGHRGSLEGRDYRGVDVLAAVAPVPLSPWFLVARMDAAEVYAPLSERLWVLTVLVATLVFGSGGALGLVWRQQSMQFYRERFETAEALRMSEARYRALLENAPVAVFINRRDRVVEANLACLRLFGATTKEELLGKSPFELFHPEFHATMRERIEILRERGEVVPLLEERILRLDGSAVDVEVTAAPFLDRGVNAIHVVLSDISERKEAERALRVSENELRQRNHELTRFTYTVSHDLKSPLVTIQTFLGYLERDLVQQDPATIAKDFGFIRTAAQKMSRLLDELLELSRVGRVKNAPVEVPLRTIAEEAVALVAGRIAQRGVRVEVSSEPILLRGDRVRLVEVFQNLVDNAVKFMGDQPAPFVEIGVETAGEELVLFVRDNGAGIDTRHAAKLFGLFEKLDPKSEGTGIGLALVRRIIEVHGGRIWVESEGLGHGACFRFTLAGTKRAPGKDVS